MIFTLENLMGSGKTTMAVAIADHFRRTANLKVLANLELYFPSQIFTLDWFVANLQGTMMEDCSMIIDEAHQVTDARSSQSKLNKVFNYFAVQTRKRGINLYLTTHNIMDIDSRLRRNIDYRGFCYNWPEIPCKLCLGRKVYNKKQCPRCEGYGEWAAFNTHFVQHQIARGRPREFWTHTGKGSMGWVYGPKVWKLFNTNERIPFLTSLIGGIDSREMG